MYQSAESCGSNSSSSCIKNLVPGQFEWIVSFTHLRSLFDAQKLGLQCSEHGVRLLDIGCGTSCAGLELALLWNCQVLTSLDCDETALLQMHRVFGGHVRGLASPENSTKGELCHSVAHPDPKIGDRVKQKSDHVPKLFTAKNTRPVANYPTEVTDETQNIQQRILRQRTKLEWIKGDVNHCEDILSENEQYHFILDKGTCDYMLAQHGCVHQLALQIVRLLTEGGIYFVVSIFPAILIKKLFTVMGLPLKPVDLNELLHKHDQTINIVVFRKYRTVGNESRRANCRLNDIKKLQTIVLDKWYQQHNPLLSNDDIDRICRKWDESVDLLTVEQAYHILVEADLQAEFSLQDFVDDLNIFFGPGQPHNNPRVPEENNTGLGSEYTLIHTSDPALPHLFADLSAHNTEAHQCRVTVEELQQNDRDSLENLVWPKTPNDPDTQMYIRRLWFDQSLEFELFPIDDGSRCLPVIPQPVNGPCLLLCSLQAHTLRRLFSNINLTCDKSNTNSLTDHINKLLSVKNLPKLTFRAQAEAIGVMLFQAATTPSYPELTKKHAAPHHQNEGNTGKVIRLVLHVTHSSEALDSSSIHIAKFPPIHSFEEAARTMYAYLSRNILEHGNFELSAATLTYSLVLCRGIALVSDEMTSEVPPIKGGIYRCPPTPSLIVHDPGNCQVGFCEDALGILGAFGRATNSLEEQAWTDRDWNPFFVGFLCGELHSQPAPFLRKPQSLWQREDTKPNRSVKKDGKEQVYTSKTIKDSSCYSASVVSNGCSWLVLSGGHCTTVLSLSQNMESLDSNQSESSAPTVTTFYVMDGLKQDIFPLHVYLEPTTNESNIPEKADKNTEKNLKKVVDIVAVRYEPSKLKHQSSLAREFQCICAQDGALEGKPRDPYQQQNQWYCRSCWMEQPRMCVFILFVVLLPSCCYEQLCCVI